MFRTFVKKLGLGAALFAGAAFIEPALANAQDIHARIQAVDHHSHDRGWDRGRWQGRDGRQWRDRDDWRWHDRSHWYPAYGGSYYLYVNPYANTAPNYYGTPSPYVTPAPPAYDQNPSPYGGYPY